MRITSSIPIVENKTMCELGETNIIRIPDGLRSVLGVEIGDVLKLDCGKVMFVEEAPPGAKKAAVASVAVVETLLGVGAAAVTPMSPDTMTIGCDPEFILIDKGSGKVVDANRIFAGKGPLGSDAGLAEIRPAPCLSPHDVVKGIRELLAVAKERTNCIPIACSSYDGWMTGFHIHFGFPKALLLQAASNSKEFIENAILTLDYLVGIPAMLRDTSDYRRLSLGDYGKPGDYRMGNNTLEYRVPGGYHLRCPEYAEELMTAAYIVMEDIIGRGQLVNRYWTDMSNFYSGEHFSEIYNTPNKADTDKILMSEDRSMARNELNNIISIYENVIYGYYNKKHLVSAFLTHECSASPFVFDNWLTM